MTRQSTRDRINDALDRMAREMARAVDTPEFRAGTAIMFVHGSGKVVTIPQDEFFDLTVRTA